MIDLLKEIERFLERTGMSPTTFGQTVMGNPNFVFGLRNGRDYRKSTERKVMAYIKGARVVKMHAKA